MNFRMAASIALLTCAGTFPAAAAATDATADFYRGKQISFIIATGSGGGYDTYGRLMARHYGRFIPGQPTMVVQNMPGAGGIRATNFIYNTAPKDGTAVALVHSGMTTLSLLEPETTKFDATKLTWLGNMEEETSLCVSWHDSPIKTTADMLTKEFIVGGTGSGANLEVYPRVMNKILGTRFRVISGYKSGNEVSLAIERGELQGRCSWPLSSIRSTRPEWLPEKKLNFLVQTGMEKDAELPNVPLVMELVKNDDDRAVMELIFAPRSLLRPVVAPPDLPSDRTAALRQAFMDTLADRGFLEDADKQRLTVTPKSGEAMQRLILKMHQAPKAVVERANQAMSAN